jgi:pimeloyl-ACP methyl ester carboxylesterase
MSYLSAGPLSDSQSLAYDVEIDVGGTTDRIGLQLNRQSAPGPFHGTVLLLHGFRASKEFMANTALYFRFLGFAVLLPDLLGHGESGGKVSFGVNDRQVLSQMLDSLPEKIDALYVAGDSMGAVAATYLAAGRSDIRGVILQAPMMIFDEAVVGYMNNYHPLLAGFMTESSIREGARKALRQAGVTLEQTDIRPLVVSLTMPVLIFASQTDPVAPLDYFAPLASETITIAKIDNRSHAGMAVIGPVENDRIGQWLRLSAARVSLATAAPLRYARKFAPSESPRPDTRASGLPSGLRLPHDANRCLRDVKP